MKIKKIKAGAFEFDCRVSGNQENETIIFLHGFPETSHMWIDLMEELSSKGFYCVAPNMRGYSKDACPKGVKHYKTQELTLDILNIADAIEKNRFNLIGHDWGALIGWNLVYNYPQRIISWAALSVPHPRGCLLYTSPSPRDS